jgi:hypothetical protein
MISLRAKGDLAALGYVARRMPRHGCRATVTSCVYPRGSVRERPPIGRLSRPWLFPRKSRSGPGDPSIQRAAAALLHLAATVPLAWRTTAPLAVAVIISVSILIGAVGLKGDAYGASFQGWGRPPTGAVLGRCSCRPTRAAVRRGRDREVGRWFPAHGGAARTKCSGDPGCVAIPCHRLSSRPTAALADAGFGTPRKPRCRT